MSAQLELDIDPAHRCLAYPPRDYDPCNCSPCQCWHGCWECGAEPGEPGCRWCWVPDAAGYRCGWWTPATERVA